MTYFGLTRGPSSSGQNVDLFCPPNTAAGDIVVASMYVEADVTVTPPTGFTLKSKISLTDSQFWTHIFWKRLTAAEDGATWTFALSATTYREANAWLFRGRKTSGDPFESFITNAVNNAASITLGSISASAGADLVAIGTSYNYLSWTPPAEFTEAHDYGQCTSMAYLANIAAGPSGTKVLTPSGTSALKGFMGSLASSSSTGTGNTAPVANAGADQTNVSPGATVTLTGSGTDADGAITAHTWTQSAGPVVSLSGSGMGARTFVAPSVQGGTTLKFSLVVTDNLGSDSLADEVMITVAAPPTPTPPAGPLEAIAGTPDLQVNGAVYTEFATAAGSPLTVLTVFENLAPASPQAYGFFGAFGGVNYQRDNTGPGLFVNGLFNTSAGTEVEKYTKYDNVLATARRAIVGFSSDGGPGRFRTIFDRVIKSVDVTGVTTRKAGASIDPSPGAATPASFAPVFTVVYRKALTDAELTNVSTWMEQNYNATPPASGNISPVVDAGTDQTVDPNLVDTIALSATASDSDGSIVSYVWEDVGASTALPGSGATRTIAVPRSTSQVAKTYRCIVTDNIGATAIDTVTVTILPHTRWRKNSSGVTPLRRLAN